MAARINKIRHDEETRLKIQTALILRKLQGHVLDGDRMMPSQVSAALALLRKTLPDLAPIAHEHSQGVTLRTIVTTVERDEPRLVEGITLSLPEPETCPN